jgi:Trypsin
MTRSRRFLVPFVLLLALCAAPVHAITYGTPDGDAHPNVGALVGDFSSGRFPYCSGTLISPTVFLTAAHCDLGNSRVMVSFDSVWSQNGSVHSGTFIASPAYAANQDDPQDIAVVIFDKPIRNIAPAALPRLGQFDRVAKNQAFTAVGYGGQERNIGPGGPVIA